jgi:RNA polymerase sigma factor (sigma-70 family)
MDYTKASKEQIWTILKADADCPLPLMEGAFQEAVNRGMVRQFIKSVIAKRGINEETRYKLHMDFEDLLQIGYIAALSAMNDYEPSKGTFTNLLFMKIHQAYGMLFKSINVKKRKGEEMSYQKLILGESINHNETFEDFLIDHKKSVEKIVIEKLELEERLSRCKPIQQETFKRYMLGYTLTEIAEQMNTKKATVQRRLKEALYKMSGQSINLSKLGLFERPKVKGA